MGTRDRIKKSDEHNARGIELADRGWMEEAASEFRKAIELDPEAAHSHDNLGAVLAEQGQLTDALASFVEALQVDPKNPNPYQYLATFLATSWSELSTSLYRHAIELDFDFCDAHFNLANVLAEGGQFEEALKEFEIAHRQVPKDENVQYELACCLLAMDRFPEAISHLKKVAKNHPEHIDAYIDLGFAYCAKGFYAEAEVALQNALKIDTNNLRALYQIAALYAAWERDKDALDYLERAADRDPEQARMWVQEDDCFDAIASDPRFKKLME